MLDLLTAEDLLDILRVSRKTLDNHLAAGRLPAPVRLGRRRYWARAAIEAALLPLTDGASHSPAPAKGGRHG